MGAFSPLILRLSKASPDEWTAIFEFKVILTTFIQSLAFRDTAVVVQQKISLTLQPVGDGKIGLPLYIMLEFAYSFYFCLSCWG